MKQDHQTSFGRHISAVPLKSRTPTLVEEEGLVDKWNLLTALTEAAEEYGLTHRTLSVLRALISFHPDRMIAPAEHSTIVFPANRTLSQRLGGMPESTLRRHLGTLVSCGIVSRHDSANRKRFARNRGEGGTRIAFGFDLSPMARMAAQIIANSQAAQNRRSELAALRAELAALRQSVIEMMGEDEDTLEAFKVLRRKPDETLLTNCITQMEHKVLSAEMSSSDIQNERHIQPEIKILPKSGNGAGDVPQLDRELFEETMRYCTEYQSFFPEPVRGWHDLSKIAHELGPMMGIKSALYEQAVKDMGRQHAAAAILCILENLASIDNPAGYLKRLAQHAASGRYCVSALFKSYSR
jgi:replication initiation protein RepC